MKPRQSDEQKKGGIAFIGAMNVDCVVHKIDRTELSRLANKTGAKRLASFSETAITDREAQELLYEVSGYNPKFQLGGSAFGAVRAANLVAGNQRFGFVGVAGAFQGKHPHYDFFEHRGIENYFVKKSNTVAATSVAFVYGGNRTLVTSLGASVEAGKMFRQDMQEIATYLSTFDAVHVTSLIDKETVENLADLLEMTIKQAPKFQISVDPGAIWSANLTTPVQRILGTSNLLILGENEFFELGGKLKNEPNIDCAARIFGMMLNTQGQEIVVRKAGKTEIYFFNHGNIKKVVVKNSNIIGDSEIYDPTGAGDTFTGLFLVLSHLRALSLTLTAAVAMTTTAEKIKHFGEVVAEDLAIGIEKISISDLDLGKLVE